MDRKSSQGGHRRADRVKKRKFRGNQFTSEEDTSFTSTSATKLKKTEDEEVIIEDNYGYCILEFISVFTALTSLVLCATCKEEIKFSRTASRGLGFKISLQCGCDDVTYINSSPFINKSFEINRRIDRSERRVSCASMEARTARKSERASENSQFEVEEGTLYEAGIAD
ncbi:hypothetical protein ABEB36_003006 [Hypothenemus hampei]|uniref:Uncharacterized protein n=1 Tax=Hypothenemus hampei TaxID=57062 RepID=A0ABD1F7Q0_HYPHA